mgnify:CR=1 FL=1|jgi:large subunit ribosomal protein L32e|tara:strand:- start:314 stop:679 length:366 start_codon:yes stop_codon:yes gene_type:complete
MKFLRRDWSRYSKLGKNRKKKQKWKNPKGRDNKMREKRKGYPAVISVGYKKNKKDFGKIENKTPKIIMNLNDLEKTKKNEIAIIGKIGKKKKIDMAKKAKEMKIKIHNLNILKFLKKIEKK